MQEKIIKVGDIVYAKNKPKNQFGALQVIEINSENAICSLYLLDKDPSGYERPTKVIPTFETFSIKDLELVEKKAEREK